MRVLSVLVMLLGATTAWAIGAPIASDSRIKTFVYNENDVFTILTHYGYQSNIEFGQGESVKTVSVGDRIGWQVVPAGRRLFVKAMEERAATNMTVVTNKHAYQFDLRASGREPLHPNEELVYVVRFFYPKEQGGEPSPALFSDGAAGFAPSMSQQFAPAAALAPVTSAAVYAPTSFAPPSFSPPQAAPSYAAGMATAAPNYNYTYSGSEKVAPLKIYDDGRFTYFTFPSTMQSLPQVLAVGPDGREMPVPMSRNQQGEVVISTIAPGFAIQQGNARVQVFNETFGGRAL